MKLNQALLTAILTIAITAIDALPAQAKAPARRTYALIVANNGSVDQGVKPLRYADDDGARYYELFSHLADDTTLLTVLDADSQRVFPKLASRTLPPSKAQLKQSVATLAAQIKADRAKGIETELYLVFTGHGNVEERSGEGYLSLLDGKLRRSDLYREVLRPLEANYTHLIIDACHAYFMVQSRGGEEDGGAWRDDRTGQTHDQELAAYLQGNPQGKERHSSTLGVLLSTSGAAEVHEWSKFRAGVFSHELRSGLLGGADQDADGRITYAELEAYLAAANAGVTNPKARINVWASAPKQDQSRPLVRLADYRQASRLKMPAGKANRYYIEDARGLRYADIHSAPEGQASIVLLREPVDRRDYFLRTDDALASVPLREDSINGALLAFAPQADQARSSVEESFRTNLFSTPFGPGFYAGFMAAREQRPDLELNAQPQAPLTRSPWSARLGVSYGLSASLLDLSGLQQDLTLNIPFLHDQGWVFGPYLSYGTSGHTSAGQDRLSGLTPSSDYRLHRISGGLEAGFETRDLTRSPLRLGIIGRAGYQGLFLSAAQLNADPLGLRAEALLRAAWAPPGWTIIPTLQAGWAINVVRRASSVEGASFTYNSPMVQLGLEL